MLVAPKMYRSLFFLFESGTGAITLILHFILNLKLLPFPPPSPLPPPPPKKSVPAEVKLSKPAVAHF